MKAFFRALPALLAAVACATPLAPTPPHPLPQVAAPSAEVPAPTALAGEVPAAEEKGPIPPERAPIPPPGTSTFAALDRAVAPPLGPVVPPHLPVQRHLILANGLKVRVVEQHRLPIVAVTLEVDAGASRDPAEEPGLASFTASMLTEGTLGRTETQISDEVGFLGASLSAAVGPDAASLSGSCLADQLLSFLEILADVAANPAFRTADFERVKDQRRVSLVQQRDQPSVAAGKTFAAAFWGNHPYGHPLIGTEAGLEKTRRDDLARFHDRYWKPANAELVVVGDVDERWLGPLLERTLGVWQAGKPAPTIAARSAAAPHRTLLIDRPGASQTYILLGSPGFDRRSPDFVAATVMFEILGGGTSSRLFRKLREEKGYTYGMGAGADARLLGGASIVRGSVKAEVTGAALKDLLAELERMRKEPVPADELEQAKDGIVRSLPVAFDSIEDVAGHLGELSIYRLPDDYWNAYAQAVERVTAAGVRRAAQAYLDPQRLTLVVVGAAGLVRPQLSGLPIGTVEVPRPRNGLLPRKPAHRRAAGGRGE